MTAWVVTVLFTPMKIPETMTAGISSARSVVQIAMTSTDGEGEKVDVHGPGDAQ